MKSRLGVARLRGSVLRSLSSRGPARLGPAQLDAARCLRGDLRNESGAVAVIVALAMVALFGFAAVAIDVGALYVERAQLQNGADAAALAIAQDCSAGTSNCTVPNAATTAQKLANLNANDAAASVATPTLTASSVTVTTSTLDGKTKAGSLAYSFAPILGIPSGSASASATVGWGSPKNGPAQVALAFSACAFKTDGSVQVLVQKSADCTRADKTVLPGGFGWLKSNGSCSLQLDLSTKASSTVGSDTGASIPGGCDAALTAALGKTILLPVYIGTAGSGANGTYTIGGWAAFKLLGWSFPGSKGHTYPGCSKQCLAGQFLRFASLDERFTLGGENFGAQLIRLQK